MGITKCLIWVTPDPPVFAIRVPVIMRDQGT
jgi:hypothetical protein